VGWAKMAQDRGTGDCLIDPYSTPKETRWRVPSYRQRQKVIRNEVTRYVLSRLDVSRCQPYGVPGGIPQEAKAGVNASDMQT
jgi:hypothetical protein